MDETRVVLLDETRVGSKGSELDAHWVASTVSWLVWRMVVLMVGR